MSVLLLRGLTRHLTTVLLASSPGSDIEEEMPNFTGDSDGAEQEGAGRVDTLGGSIGRILHAWDVLCVYHSVAIFRKLEYALKDVVGGPVGTAPFPPSFDDSPIVPVYNDVIAFG